MGLIAGRIAKLLSFVRGERNSAKLSDVTVDPGGKANVRGQHFASPGDDAFPLETDYAVIVSIPRSRGGDGAVVGYADILTDKKTTAGDKRIYARNSSSGADVVELWLKNTAQAVLSNANGSVVLNPNGSVVVSSPAGTVTVAADGSITLVNGSGSIALAASGIVTINGLTIDTSGNLQTSGSIQGGAVSGASVVETSGSINLKDHVHSGVQSGGSNTGPAQ